MGVNRYTEPVKDRTRAVREAEEVRAEARRILAEIGPDPEARLNRGDLYAALATGHVDPKHRSEGSTFRVPSASTSGRRDVHHHRSHRHV